MLFLLTYDDIIGLLGLPGNVKLREKGYNFYMRKIAITWS